MHLCIPCPYTLIHTLHCICKAHGVSHAHRASAHVPDYFLTSCYRPSFRNVARGGQKLKIGDLRGDIIYIFCYINHISDGGGGIVARGVKCPPPPNETLAIHYTVTKQQLTPAKQNLSAAVDRCVSRVCQ